MKLVIFGLTISSSWGNGHATLWRALCRALSRDGHCVVFFERDVDYYASHRDYFELPGGRIVFYRDWNQILPVAARELSDADAGMVTSYCPDGGAASELVLECRSVKRCFYDLDTPVTLEHLRAGQSVSYLPPEGLSGFDLVLSYTGGMALRELQDRLGARRVVPLYGSVDPEVHRAVAPEERFRCDLSYLGTYAADRQAVLEALFIEPARRLPALKFLIGGAQYPESFPWAPNIFFASHVSPPEHPAFFSSCRMTLNVTRGAMAAMGYCPSGRLFEAAACGVPILSDTWEGLDQFFRPGKEILVAHDTEQAIEAMRMPQAVLERIAQAARARAVTEHSAARRADELLTALAEVPHGWQRRSARVQTVGR